MPTVTGLTAARMAEIEAASIVDAELSGSNLVLEKHDGTPINVGNVRGPAGPDTVEVLNTFPPSLTNSGVPSNGIDPAEDALSALLPGTYNSEENAQYRLDGRATLDPGVNIEGQGSGNAAGGISDDDGTKFVCTSADAELYFGPIGCWGKNGQFHIDGQDIALTPLHLDIVVNAIFADIKVQRAAQHNILLEGTQNSTFDRIESNQPGLSCLCLDYGCGNNRFEGLELNQPGTYCLILRASGPVRPGSFTVAYNYNNQFYGGIFEYMYGSGLGGVYQSAGLLNRFGHGLVIAINDGPVGVTGITLENDAVPNFNGAVVLEGIWIQGVPAWSPDPGAGESIGVDLKSTNADYALHAYGHNPMEHLKDVIRYPAGLYTPCSIHGRLGVESVAGIINPIKHGDALPGYPGGYPEGALLYAQSYHAMQVHLSTEYDIAYTARKRGDIHPRMHLAPNSLAFGDGTGAPAAHIQVGYQADHVYTNGMFCAVDGLGSGGITEGAPVSAASRKMPIYNEAGGLMGYIPISVT